MEGAVYVLCGSTALLCSLLLLRAYRRRRIRLLLWCGLFFVVATLENAILFLDLIVIPQTDLMLLRSLVALSGVMLLIYGLTFDAR